METLQNQIPENVPNVEREIITALMIIRDRRNSLEDEKHRWNGDAQSEREELDQRLSRLINQKNKL